MLDRSIPRQSLDSGLQRHQAQHMHRLKVLTLQHQYLFVKIPGRFPLAYFVQAHCLLKKDVYVRSGLRGCFGL